MIFPLEVRDRRAARCVWGVTRPGIGPVRVWTKTAEGTLANWQAPGFNKPQRSGLIRTCPDRSTGSKPLEDVTLDGVSHPILMRVLRGILKRPFDLTARVTVNDRPNRRRLAYIEHEHRSHRFFASIHTRPSYGDRPKAIRSVGPGIVPDRTRSSHPVISADPYGASPPTFTRMTEPKV